MKKVIIAFLVAVLCLGVFSSALATNNLYTTYQAEWGAMPLQKTTSYQSKPTKAIQHMLLYYNSSTNSIIANAGGVDGSFGASTESAVEIFQTNMGNLTVDGKVGSATWRALYGNLDHELNDDHDTTTAYVFTMSNVEFEKKVIKRAISTLAWYNMYNNSIFYQA